MNCLECFVIFAGIVLMSMLVLGIIFEIIRFFKASGVSQKMDIIKEWAAYWGVAIAGLTACLIAIIYYFGSAMFLIDYMPKMVAFLLPFIPPVAAIIGLNEFFKHRARAKGIL